MDPNWVRKMEERIDAQNAEIRRLQQGSVSGSSGMSYPGGPSRRSVTNVTPTYYRPDDPQTYGPPIPVMQRLNPSPISHRPPPQQQHQSRQEYTNYEEDRRREQHQQAVRQQHQQALQQQQQEASQATALHAEEKRQLLSQLHAERTKSKGLETEAHNHARTLNHLQQQVGSLTQDLAAVTEAHGRIRQRLHLKEQELDNVREAGKRDVTVWGNVCALKASWGTHMDNKDYNATTTAAAATTTATSSGSRRGGVTRSAGGGGSESIIIGSEAPSVRMGGPIHSSSSAAGYKRERDEFDVEAFGGTSMTLGTEDPPPRMLSLVRVLPPTRVSDTPVKGRRTAAPRKPSVTNADRVGATTSRGVVKIPASPLPKAPNARTRTAIDPNHGSSVGGHPSVSKVTDATSFSASFSRQGGGPLTGHAPITRSPSPNNPKRGLNIERRFVLSGFSESEMVDIERAINKLGLSSAQGDHPRAMILQCDRDGDLPSDCTHVLIPHVPQNFKALCGLVSERWIVNPNFVFNSLDAGFWLDERDTQHLHYTPSPLSHHRFAIHMPESTPEERELKRRIRTIIELGKGTVVSKSATHEGVVVINSGKDILNFCMK